MGKLNKFGAILALMGSPAIAAEVRPQPACLSASEARALFTYAIPEALDGVSKSCKANLPSNSFLATQADETIARFRAEANGAWPSARSAFLKIAGSGDEAKLVAGLPDKALQPLVAAAFSGVVAKEVKPAQCARIDRFVAALARVAPANVAELLAAFMGLVGGDDGGDFKVC